MKIFYMPIERLESRYTFQLTDWNVREFKRLRQRYHIVDGAELPSTKGKVITGSVLDAHGRSFFALQQMSNLIALLKAGKPTCFDTILFEDMFTPGMEILPYILRQTDTNYRPKVYVRCLAQTIDPDDFVNREGMFDWMRHYELMLDKFVTGILVASEEMVANLKIAGFKAPIHVTGLPFGKKEVQARVKHVAALEDRPKVVSFASRWDTEKQPEFFLEVAEKANKLDPDIKFQVLTGFPKLKSDDPYFIRRAQGLARKSFFSVKAGLTKNDYYGHLANSRLLFNCALQDWVSNTVSEADSFGTQTLFPAYRSFPEVFANNAQHMYIPWSVDDAVNKLVALVNLQTPQTSIGEVSDYQDKSIERTIGVLRGSDNYLRAGPHYRSFVTRKNY